jgi:hypothetical protein
MEKKVTSNTFKQYLLKEERESTFYTKKSQINAWMKAHGIGQGNYEIHKDMSVTCHWSLSISGSDLVWYKGKQCVLPINFRECTKDVHVLANDMLDLKGVPRFVGGQFNVKGKNITSFEYLPEEAEDIYLHNTGIINFKGIEKVVKKVYSISIPEDTKGLLSFVKIQNLMKISPLSTAPDDLKKACQIVSDFCKAGSKNVLACQEKLIDNDLKDYAEL